MKKILFSVLVLALALVYSLGTAAAADEKKVVVKGEAAIFQNDKSTAKEKAIEQALRNAVEQVVGTYVKSSTLVENYITVEDKIFSQSKGFVKSWRELSAKEVDGVMEVEVEATVAAAKLKGSLDEIEWALAKKDYPRLMVLIAEQNIGESGYSYWWGNTTGSISMSQVENTLIDQLSPKGFIFVDPQVLAGKIQMKDAYKVTSAGISNQAAVEIANLTNAQVVLVGTAIATNAGPVMQGSKLQSGQCDITVRAINTDNGEILMTASVHAAEAHISPPTAGNKALIKGGKKLSEQIVKKLVDRWLNSTAIVTLEVVGLTGYPMLDELQSALQNEVRGVKGVSLRKMMKDSAQIDLYYSGKVALLASELTQKTFKGIKVQVENMTANQLKLRVSKR